MKKFNNLLVGVLVLLAWSCVQDDDFGVPNITSEDPMVPVEKLTTFKAITSLYEQAVNGGNALAVIEDDIYIEGYVVSSDKGGNFFEELIIQNKTDDSNPDNDPRLGFKIDINQSSLSDTYQFGQKVIVKLQGLAVGASNGVVTIGREDGVNVGQIQPAEYRDIVLRTNEINEIQPKVVSIPELTEADESTLIQLNNMQLNRFELGATFASESFDEFDGLRLMESCNSGAQIIMQTSTFSDFKSLLVPQGNGSMIGVYSRDFRDDFSVILPKSSADINFESTERCDPEEFSCGIASSFGTGNLFFEDFESQRNNRPIEGNGWTNYIEAGSEAWEGWSSTSTNASLGRSCRFQSGGSGDTSNIGWLITPEFDLDAQDGETLRFKTSNSRADSSYMEVFYADDWDGTEDGVADATWKILSDAYVVKDSDSFVEWLLSRTVDLSCLSGTIHIAFKYTGGGQDSFDGIYELDDVSVDFVE
ncbi:hypothetical protein EYD45_09690 [Hyunsoonleella flava]|uniref:DUF5689 domain-containing protein n=1 Tax=Hyunsoonleella flava TaxID=2527939 RepID=A0A4Q9FJ37_9FLAO|nr:DUF5689 domain-containing protein [Hyunsoonleella flava]TBN03272.1 hypothetical protein EYD45_09690 [Hyunsoonleella flava]